MREWKFRESWVWCCLCYGTKLVAHLKTTNISIYRKIINVVYKVRRHTKFQTKQISQWVVKLFCQKWHIEIEAGTAKSLSLRMSPKSTLYTTAYLSIILCELACYFQKKPARSVTGITPNILIHFGKRNKGFMIVLSEFWELVMASMKSHFQCLRRARVTECNQGTHLK